jgi:hypothetical protein
MLLVGMVSTFFVASVALAASDAPKARTPNLSDAVRGTEAATSFRYAISIAVDRRTDPARVLEVHGVSGDGQLFVRVRQAVVQLFDGTKVPGPEAAAMIDGPYLYERAPAGIAVNGTITWLRVPIAKIGRFSPVMGAVRALTPMPLLRVLGESHAAATSRIASKFAGMVRYDDPIVRAAITHLTGGVEFHDLRVTAEIGADGLVHGVGITGLTADGSTTLTITAHLFAFGRPVHLTPPAGTALMDQQLLTLAE